MIEYRRTECVLEGNRLANLNQFYAEGDSARKHVRTDIFEVKINQKIDGNTVKTIIL